MVGPLRKLHFVDYLDMVDENIIEVEFSVAEIVHLVQSSDHMAIEGLVAGDDEHFDPNEEPNATTNKNDMEFKSIHLVESRVSAKKLLHFILSEGLESFSCPELLQVEQICDKLSRMCVAHITATKKSHIKNFMLHG